MRGYETEVEVPLGNDIYTCNVTWYPGSPPGRDDPGDGGEIETPTTVEVVYEDGRTDVVSWTTFVLEYATYCAVTIDTAEGRLLNKMHEQAQDQLADRLGDE